MFQYGSSMKKIYLGSQNVNPWLSLSNYSMLIDVWPWS
jgi:hypothetical protein